MCIPIDDGGYELVFTYCARLRDGLIFSFAYAMDLVDRNMDPCLTTSPAALLMERIARLEAMRWPWAAIIVKVICLLRPLDTC